MPFKQHTWRAGEETTLENLNRIEEGIAVTEARITTEAEAIERAVVELTAPAVPRDGSSSMKGILLVPNIATGMIYDDNKRIVANAAGIEASAPSLVLPGNAKPYNKKRMYAEGVPNQQSLYAGTNKLSIVKVAGLANDGTPITSPRSGGIPLDSASGDVLYMMMLTVNVTRTLAFTESVETYASIKHSSGASSFESGDVQASDKDRATMIVTWVAMLPTGGYIYPSIRTPTSIKSPADYTIEVANLIVYRLN